MKLVKTACSSRTLHAKGALISIIANDINNEHDDFFDFFKSTDTVIAIKW